METKTQYIAEIVYDDCPEDPLEWNDYAQLINTACPQYDRYVPKEQAEEILAKAREDGNVIFPIYFTDHSNFSLNIGGPIDRWDSGFYGYLILAMAELCLKEGDVKKQMEIAQGFIDDYNTYLDGGVLAVRIAKQEICPCCDSVLNEETEEFYGGFYSLEDANDCIQGSGYEITEVKQLI